MAYSVFISYSTQDIEVVQHLQQQLKSAMVEVFVAEYSAPPGDDLSRAIDTAIRNCDLFVLLWSKNAEASSWVTQEIGLAKGCNKTILPVVLQSNLPLPAFISNLKYVDVSKDSTQGVDQVRQIVYANAEKQNQNAVLVLLGALVLLAVLAVAGNKG